MTKNNRLLPWAVGVAILGCVLAVSANVTTSKIHDNLDNERLVRMTYEQQLQIAKEKIRVLEIQLAVSNRKFESIAAILDQGRNTTNNLQSRLDAVTKEKETLAAKMIQIENKAEAK